MRRSIPFLVGLFAGAVLAAASARADGSAVPDLDFATAAWPILSADQREIVDLVAQGETEERFAALPEARKQALRGAALRQLGFNRKALERTAI
ncbi:hypothetical protein [Parvularcula dongshanensis]|uniref:DUF3106 domain-containing protein n=1 Tax=Parvularcula dongshanensis TaxID=1173995 RepID=A0A840I5S5_9PROT|nr:hypothetical protein [Parvularcula dongshanensis]MBB4659498.1 hypothetical protein [Parvularcula dongshanensis]